jgi:hypothetical protein
MTVSITRDGATAIVTIDNPPVNALGLALRQGLWPPMSGMLSAALLFSNFQEGGIGI